MQLADLRFRFCFLLYYLECMTLYDILDNTVESSLRGKRPLPAIAVCDSGYAIVKTLFGRVVHPDLLRPVMGEVGAFSLHTVGATRRILTTVHE